MKKIKVNKTKKSYKNNNDNINELEELDSENDINNVDINAAAYIRQIPATNGEFTANFKIADYYSTKMAIYLGGTGIDTKVKNEADVAENKYVYVASLDIGGTNTLTATALVRNFAEIEKEAYIIVAQYSADNELEDVRIEKKTIPAKTISIRSA